MNDPTRTESCLSELRVIQLDAGELDAAMTTAARAHLDGCARCATRLAEVATERVQFTAAATAETPIWLAPPRATSSWRRRAIVVGPLLGLAAGVALLLTRSPDGAGPDPGVTQIKGAGLTLGLFIRRDDAVIPGGPGDTVYPGDQLRFALRGTGTVHVAVLSLDGARHASIYAPTDGAPLARTLTNEPQLLPGAIELDDALGAERLFAVACATPFEVEPLRAALERTGNLVVPGGCQVDELALDKVARP